jgi:hypothetical protein
MQRAKPATRRGWVWAERLCAVVLALLVLMVHAPDLASMTLPFPIAVFGPYVAYACLFVACIVVGQGRSRTLRIVGWVALLAWVVVELRIL